MPKLLTIAIPAYSRANILDRQLAWLAQHIQKFESGRNRILEDSHKKNAAQPPTTSSNETLISQNYKVQVEP